MCPQVSLSHIQDLRCSKFTELDVADASVLVAEDLSGSIHAPHNVKEACGIISRSIQLLSVFGFPFIAVAFSVAGACLPELHLVSPVDISDNLVLGEIEASGHL